MHRTFTRAAGWLWIAAWFALLWLFVAPWADMGGIVSERWRWANRVVLGVGLVVGGEVGSLGRRAARPATGLSHARLLRRTHLLPAGGAAAGLLILRLLGMDEAIGVLTTALLAFCAGVDFALAAWPLVLGEPYSFRGSIPTPDDLPDLDPLGGEARAAQHLPRGAGDRGFFEP